MNLLVFPVIIVVVVSILVLSILLARWNANKLENAVLSSATGNIRFDQSYSSKSSITTYYVFVGRKKFKFANDMGAVFNEGHKYKFHYCRAGMYEFVMSYESLQ
jgi:hypothetical protein